MLKLDVRTQLIKRSWLLNSRNIIEFFVRMTKLDSWTTYQEHLRSFGAYSKTMRSNMVEFSHLSRELAPFGKVCGYYTVCGRLHDYRVNVLNSLRDDLTTLLVRGLPSGHAHYWITCKRPYNLYREWQRNGQHLPSFQFHISPINSDQILIQRYTEGDG